MTVEPSGSARATTDQARLVYARATRRENVTLPVTVDGVSHDVPDVPARLCTECGDVVSMPRESTPVLTAARERIRAGG